MAVAKDIPVVSLYSILKSSTLGLKKFVLFFEGTLELAFKFRFLSFFWVC